MKKTKIIYWIFTGLLVALMVLGSIPDIMSVPDAVALFNHLGYPTYLLPFIGIAKLLGVVAILIPGFPRIKEWAYAGFVFDLTGAMYSSISVGDPVSGWLIFIIGYILIAGSYIYHHKILKSTSVSNKVT
ncbi:MULTISPECIES: DoxX family protein [unclassified Bacillus (in: firmicutes)]|uniref:DoxX family protein n=1 Tax=unclassified Bacillus (in: firmicutes) TaxID=185979 RepID=UPI001BED2C07|nr:MULTISPECIES: DoxX family protein [unclassified Bacillus (in: firmicutes)]MBT2618422.1 DoxX family protein [Bacillus sp. ISL-78]MBT2630713.1 DoxX family protein [Bacillus sp. ISL-101]MBT2718786.1 DoxX family protein [Bacillus sp. ISL-57]